MGILDDAIRQHLDLKRRLGADDVELARLEDEAFGPPTRPGDPDFPDTGSEKVVEEGEASSPDGSGAAGNDPVEPPTAQAQEAVVEPLEADQEELDVGAAEQPLLPDTGEQPLPDIAEEPLPETAEELVLPDTGEQPYAPPIESLDTVEHPIDEALDTGEAEVVEGELEEPPPATGDGEEDEDVLEETPEFLRDQPEDDELWFEQGEPKDFDF